MGIRNENDQTTISKPSEIFFANLVRQEEKNSICIFQKKIGGFRKLNIEGESENTLPGVVLYAALMLQRLIDLGGDVSNGSGESLAVLTS